MAEVREDKGPGFFAIFPMLGKLLWLYARRLLNLETLAKLEQKQGATGQQTEEELLFERELERNPHQFHFSRAETEAHTPSSVVVQAKDRPVVLLAAKKEIA